MDSSAFTTPAGDIVRTPQGYEAFLPSPLPRRLPLDDELTYLLSEADRRLGELAGMARTLPNPQLLIAPLSQREAVLSSRIEGTQASLSDVALFEAAGDASPGQKGDVREVRNYRLALEYGLQRLESLPLSLRLVREVHDKLMTGVRGDEMHPGEFRSVQNWIGAPGSSIEESTYVPPPPDRMLACLADWESFLHEDLRLPPLVRCALMHYQFEAIHPFLDGNGRIGRLLIILFLLSLGRLPAPVLYLSPFFEKNRRSYYELLRGVSERSDWDAWLRFFLVGVVEQCSDAFRRSNRLRALHEHYRRRLLDDRAPPSALNLLEELFLSPAITAAVAADRLHLTPASAYRAIEVLCGLGIVTEVTGRRRDRIYLAGGVLDAIETETRDEDD